MLTEGLFTLHGKFLDGVFSVGGDQMVHDLVLPGEIFILFCCHCHKEIATEMGPQLS